MYLRKTYQQWWFILENIVFQLSATRKLTWLAKKNWRDNSVFKIDREELEQTKSEDCWTMFKLNRNYGSGLSAHNDNNWNVFLVSIRRSRVWTVTGSYEETAQTWHEHGTKWNTCSGHFHPFRMAVHSVFSTLQRTFSLSTRFRFMHWNYSRWQILSLLPMFVYGIYFCYYKIRNTVSCRSNCWWL